MTTGEYAQTLRAWPLYDCSGVHASPGNEELAQLWRRWRGTRGKPVTASVAVTQESLDASWTAFVHRWNTKPRFADVVPMREERRRQYGIHELREVVCELLWDADRVCCYVHFHEGCDVCRGFRIPRPSNNDWEGFVAENPIGEYERVWVRRYRRALSAFERGQRSSLLRGRERENYSPRGSRSRSRSPLRARSPPRARSPSPVRRAAGLHEAPTYRSRGRNQASGCDTLWSAGPIAAGCDVMQRRDDHSTFGRGAREDPRQSSAALQRCPRAEEEHHVESACSSASWNPEDLSAWQRRVDYIGHDADRAADQAKEAELLGEQNSGAIAALECRLKRLEQSNRALRDDNAALRSAQRLLPAPPRAPR